jgi:Actin
VRGSPRFLQWCWRVLNHATTAMTSTTASAIRPGLRDNRTLSGSPHTPSRFVSSNYSSPGSTFRQEEDAVIFELTPRQLYAGFEGESGPQCAITFGPENSGRAGDYRIWLPDYKRLEGNLEDAAGAYELWRNNSVDVDLGLLEDKLERAVRTVYSQYLLTDTGTARLVLVLPSVVPVPVISSILMTLFERWRYSTVTLLPAPTMCVVSAGVRSALVVDCGWEETVVTPVYEYRELAALRSTRGMKMLTLKMGKMLKGLATRQTPASGQVLRLDFDFVEDFISRVASCEAEGGEPHADSTDESSVQWPTQSGSLTVGISRNEVSRVVHNCFFDEQNEVYQDDQEKTVDRLLFQSLLSLPPDIRGTCMSRIIFKGPGAVVSGLKELTVTKLDTLIKSHGWTAVRGRHVKSTRRALVEIAQVRASSPDARHNVLHPAEKDYVEEKLHKQRSKEVNSDSQGSLQCIESLGAWAGASLLTSLKVKSVVEVERDQFLSHGVFGATREADISAIAQRVGGLAVGTTKSNDRSSWTLGNWG